MTKTRHATRAGLAALAMALATSVAMADTVVLTAYSGIFQENYVKAVVEPFMKANPDITVEFYGMPNSAQMLGTLRPLWKMRRIGLPNAISRDPTKSLFDSHRSVMTTLKWSAGRAAMLSNTSSMRV